MSVMGIEARAFQPAVPLIGQLVVGDFHFLPSGTAVDDIGMSVVLALLDLAAEILDRLEMLSGLLGIIEMLFVPLRQLEGDDFGVVVTGVVSPRMGVPFVAVIVFGFQSRADAGTDEGQ